MLKNRLRNRIRTKEAKIAVIGMGSVGLPTATILANSGFQVTGIDTNHKIVNEVSHGKCHKMELGLKKLVSKVVRQGKLTATQIAYPALDEADIAIVCVQTPVNKDRKPHLTHLKKACETIAKALTKGKLVIMQSTIPPKTTENLVVPLLEELSGLKCGVDFWLSYCPERMTPGRGIKDLETNTRVIGGYNLESAELGAELFGVVTKGELQITDVTTAEVVKLSENSFRYVNIAFANELALISKEIGVDVEEVIRLANTHPRVNIHKPGCGVGGPCLSKDTHLLLHSVRTKNFRPHILLASIKSNDYMPKYTVKLVLDSLRKVGKSVECSKISILGTAYKGEVDDARNSPAEEIIRGLLNERAKVVFYDPYCVEGFGAERANDIIEAAKDTDCIVITTEHKASKELNLSRLKALMKENPIIVDGRRIIKPSEAERNGIIYVGIGYSDRPSEEDLLY